MFQRVCVGVPVPWLTWFRGVFEAASLLAMGRHTQWFFVMSTTAPGRLTGVFLRLILASQASASERRFPGRVGHRIPTVNLQGVTRT